jgi:hypothetical protein
VPQTVVEQGVSEPQADDAQGYVHASTLVTRDTPLTERARAQQSLIRCGPDTHARPPLRRLGRRCGEYWNSRRDVLPRLLSAASMQGLVTYKGHELGSNKEQVGRQRGASRCTESLKVIAHHTNLCE